MIGFQWKLTHANFKDIVKFDCSEFDQPMFLTPTYNFQKKLREPPIRLDHTTFEKKLIFRGEAQNPFQIGIVSLKGVELENEEFHNVKWIKLGSILKRDSIIDELLLSQNPSSKPFDEVMDIYDRLRKYYETRLSYNQASNFFIGKIDTERKKFRDGGIFEELKSFGYLVYKLLNLYGESTYLPLIVWTPIVIILFALHELFVMDLLNKTYSTR